MLRFYFLFFVINGYFYHLLFSFRSCTLNAFQDRGEKKIKPSVIAGNIPQDDLLNPFSAPSINKNSIWILKFPFGMPLALLFALSAQKGMPSVSSNPVTS